MTDDLIAYIIDKIDKIFYALDLIDPRLNRDDSVGEYLHRFKAALQEMADEEDV
jgi:hypothetical protein